MLIFSNNSNITSVDPQTFVDDPSTIKPYISFPEQKYNLIFGGAAYSGPVVEIKSVTGTEYQVSRGIVEVTYEISNFFNADCFIVWCNAFIHRFPPPRP